MIIKYKCEYASMQQFKEDILRFLNWAALLTLVFNSVNIRCVVYGSTVWTLDG